MAKNCFRAFTLIELLVVTAIIIILGALVVSVSSGVIERAKATKDMSNLRQIGTATQLYMNDNDGVIFATGAGAASWMKQLHPKYLASWNIFLSPFDHPAPPRTASEDDTNAAVSYGINSNSVGISADKISKATTFILFAPAQASGVTVSFQGAAGTAAPGVTVLGNGGGTATSTPGGGA